MEIEEVDRVPFLAGTFAKSCHRWNRWQCCVPRAPEQLRSSSKGIIREVSDKNTYSEVRVVSTLEDSRRAAWSQLASPPLCLSFSLSSSLAPSQLSLFSLCTWLQRTFRNKDNARTAPRNEEGNDITQRATEHTRHASTNGVVREGG